MIERPDSFTPSNNSPEFLEEIFVQRHRLLEKAVAWSKDSIIHKQKKHLLFIGPRGSGKTHLISMIVNRLEIQAESQAVLQNKMLIVWLGEDDIITNFLDLMSSILITLVQTYPDQFHDNSLQSTGALDIDAKAEQIIHSINEQLGDRTIVLVKENLSDVFRGLKDTGQKKFRSFLQEQRNMLVLASSQQLFDGIASRDAAFFGFFDTHHLKPLDLEEAMKLVTKLTEQKGDQKLLAFLKTPQGYFRMRALHYLAGGNHRLYISLLDFLTMESFDDLVIALQDLVIDLTPYFQERIRSLPPQQGKIIQ
ncbi:MAG: ATP-binding protein, partial [Thiotrichaceae bacterium]|nr:ATP-binding protein [Thiotrichaceae bacterium]